MGQLVATNLDTNSRYFTRLWCLYEIGAFLRLHQQRRLEIIPTSFGVYLCISSFLLSLSYFVNNGLEAASLSYDIDFELQERIGQLISYATIFLGLFFYMRLLRAFGCFLKCFCLFEANSFKGERLLFNRPSELKRICLLFGNHLGTMAELSEKVSSFRVRDAECFCCSVSHCMPATGEEIPCDRRVVYGTLGMWYSGDDSTDPLESFDREVRYPGFYF